MRKTLTIRPISMKNQCLLEIAESGSGATIPLVSLQFPTHIAEGLVKAVQACQEVFDLADGHDIPTEVYAKIIEAAEVFN